MSTNTLLIIRGLPGCGKTELAQTIKALSPHKVEIVSLDDQRVNENGDYIYSAEPLIIESQIRKMLKILEDTMVSGVELIILDNTHSRLREFEEAQNLASFHDYNVRIINIEYENIDTLFERREHGNKTIPSKAILKMRNRWEYSVNPKPFGWYIYRIKKCLKNIYQWLLE